MRYNATNIDNFTKNGSVFGGFDDKDNNYTQILSVDKYPYFTDTWEKATDL